GVLANTIEGHVLDHNGNPLPGIQVIYTRPDAAVGASVVTVFSSEDGRFNFPDDYAEIIDETSVIRARGLGFRQIERFIKEGRSASEMTFILQAVDNQVDVAPASAWLARVTDRAE